MRKSEAELCLFEDIRSKKLAASGVHHKTGKRGHVGRMRFPFELGTRAERMRYKKAGKVIVTNLYEKILTKNEFDQLPDEEKKNQLQHWRKNYDVKTIQKSMGVAAATFYRYVSDLELPRMERGKNKNNKKRTGTAPTATIKAAAMPGPALELEQQKEPPLLLLNGLNICYTGQYTPEDISKMLNKIDLLLDGETTKFDIELRLTQR